MLDHISVPYLLLISLFCALAVWYAGKKLVLYADVISKKTGLDHALIGTVILALITSLPEIATTITASRINNPNLAINNLLGGVVIQTAILPFADFIFTKQPLTKMRLNPSLLIAALFLILQLSVASIGFTIGEFIPIFHFGLWPFVLVGIYICFLVALKRRNTKETQELAYSKKELKQVKKLEERHVVLFTFLFCFFAAVVFLAGWLIALTANSLAQQTGIQSTFLGATFLAIITSLPEISTTFCAIRVKAYNMAFSNVFGSNAFMLALIVVAEFALPTPIFEGFNTSAIYLSSLGILVTGIYLWGLIEKKDRAILRMGIDSLLVLLFSLLGMIALYLYF